MKKIFLSLMLTIVILSGCGRKSLKEVPNNLNITDEKYSSNNLIVGSQIAPGNITVKINENKNQYLTISYTDGTNIYCYNQDSNSFEKQDLSEEPKNSTYTDMESSFRISYSMVVGGGTEIVLPHTFADNEILTINTTPYFMCLYGATEEFFNNKSDIDVISDGSGEYDDSWSVSGGKKKQEFSLNADDSLTRLSISRNGIDSKYFKVGEDITSGYIKLTCDESTNGVCKINATSSVYAEGKETYSMSHNIPELEVGGTYIIPIPMVAGMGIEFAPKPVYGEPDAVIEKFSLEMLPELPQEENTEDSNN